MPALVVVEQGKVDKGDRRVVPRIMQFETLWGWYGDVV